MTRWEPHAAFWKGRRVLVTGSAGFIGGRILGVLADLGSIVAGFDIRSTREREAYLADVRDFHSVERAVVEVKPDVIFHLAAITQIVDAGEMPVLTYETNVLGSVNVLEAAFGHVSRAGREIAVVVASSDKAYGSVDDSAKEILDLSPLHPYEVSKACADMIARSYGEGGARVAVTRSGNVYGPGDDNWQRLIPSAISAGLTGETLEVRSDGTLIREYNFIDDVVEAYLLIAQEQMGAVRLPRVFNISDPDCRRTVLQVIDAVGEALGTPVAYTIENKADREPQMNALDSSSIRESLGWQPKVSMSEGLDRTVRWSRMMLAASRRPL